MPRRIVAAYRASGVPAKIHRGRLFVAREEGWEGPLDARQLHLRDPGRLRSLIRSIARCGYMCRTVWVHNTSRHSDAEVRECLAFAVQDVDMRRVCVNVKNGALGGAAYNGVPEISNAPRSAR